MLDDDALVDEDNEVGEAVAVDVDELLLLLLRRLVDGVEGVMVTVSVMLGAGQDPGACQSLHRNLDTLTFSPEATCAKTVGPKAQPDRTKATQAIPIMMLSGFVARPG